MSKRRRRKSGASATPSVTSPPAPPQPQLEVTKPAAVAPPALASAEAFDPVPSQVEITKPSPVLPRLVDAWPHLVLREATLAIALCALVIAIAFAVDAPLAGLASPTQPDNPEKAPWYFVGMQEMVSYSARSGAVLFPLALVAGLLLLPLIDRRGERTGRWFADSGWPIALVSALVGAAVAGLGLALWESAAIGARVLDPATLVLIAGALAAAAGLAVRRRWSAGGVALVAVLIGAYLVFTVVGVWCRGPSWQFFWPWQPWTGGGAP
ncbi:MAG: hypothetical protein JXR83_09250 [Deltaproteobacteria bacterium]|nr:hypothetical protein [Deltaproteobacteria bacterium]